MQQQLSKAGDCGRVPTAAHSPLLPSHLRTLLPCSAVCLDLLEKADVLDYYDASVRSVQEE